MKKVISLILALSLLCMAGAAFAENVRKSPGRNHLTAPVLDGKAFWQVEEGTPIQIKEA